MDLFYLPHLDKHDAVVEFSPNESRHLCKVLRKNSGDSVYATNGKGIQYTIELQHMNPRKTTGMCIASSIVPPLPYELHLAIAPTKNIGRFEWFLEKATEIGITHITPLLCDHSERTQIKMERLEKILVAALKQCQGYHLPALFPLTPFDSFVSQHPDALIAHCGAGKKKPLHSLVQGTQSNTILIGPEGDFSSREIALAQSKKMTEVHLGSRRLRTETAAISACCTVALAWQ